MGSSQSACITNGCHTPSDPCTEGLPLPDIGPRGLMVGDYEGFCKVHHPPSTPIPAAPPGVWTRRRTLLPLQNCPKQCYAMGVLDHLVPPPHDSSASGVFPHPDNIDGPGGWTTLHQSLAELVQGQSHALQDCYSHTRTLTRAAWKATWASCECALNPSRVRNAPSGAMSWTSSQDNGEGGGLQSGSGLPSSPSQNPGKRGRSGDRSGGLALGW